MFRRLTLCACILLLAACSDQTAPPEKLRVRVLAVDAVAESYAPTLVLTGIVAAQTESSLSFRVGGRVAERLVDVGDHVDAGQVLARIDPAEQESDVRSAQAGVDAAQARVTQTQAALQRQQSLLNQGFTTRRDFDLAKQAADVAASSLDAAQAQLRNVQETQGFTELRADKPGVITARNIEAGQVVQAAQAAYTIAEDGGRDAVFNVSESLASPPPPTQDIDVTLLSDRAVRAKGKLREVSPVIDPASGTIRVKVGLIDPGPELRLGAAVAGSVAGYASQAISLPWTALQSDGGKPAVWTVDMATSAVALKSVEVLSYDTGSVVLRSGLSAGEKVVVAGGQLLRPGLVVEVAGGSAQ